MVGIGVYFILNNEKSQVVESDSLYDSSPETEKWVNNEEIQIFRKYLTFPTISLEADFGNLIKQLKISIDLKPICNKNRI